MSVSPEKRRRLLQAAEGRIEDLAEIFKTLADPTRVRILLTLAESETCVHEISARVGMSQSAVSHQLRLLRAGRLVKSRRAGREIYYSLDDEHVLALLSKGLEHAGHSTQGGV